MRGGQHRGELVTAGTAKEWCAVTPALLAAAKEELLRGGDGAVDGSAAAGKKEASEVRRRAEAI